MDFRAPGCAPDQDPPRHSRHQDTPQSRGNTRKAGVEKSQSGGQNWVEKAEKAEKAEKTEQAWQQ